MSLRVCLWARNARFERRRQLNKTKQLARQDNKLAGSIEALVSHWANLFCRRRLQLDSGLQLEEARIQQGERVSALRSARFNSGSALAGRMSEWMPFA